MEIYDFLPKYPEIESDNFYQDIFNKKEFYDEKLDRTETIPERPGVYMKHQILSQRYVSPYTQYDGVLLAWDMGTGKTCSAVAICEGTFQDSNSNIISAVYLAKGEGLLEKFMKSVAEECTDNLYLPENYNPLMPLYRNRRNALVRQKYKTQTYKKFSKEIESMSTNKIKRKYSNKIIIIDEIHNIKIGDPNEVKFIYEQLHKFLHLIENYKIVLMSGTPMYDSPDEIASIMNLILPLNNQLPIGRSFISEYMRNGDGKIYTIKHEKINDLKGYFRGRVSYLTNMDAGFNVEYIGEIISPLTHFHIFPTYFENNQKEGYNRALNADYRTEKDSGRARNLSLLQASMFVYPDGTYGKEGFEKNLEITKSNIVKPKNNFLNDIGSAFGLGEQSSLGLENLKKYSAKYYFIIKQALELSNNPTGNRKIFIYSESIKGSGLFLLGKLFEHFYHN